MDLIERQNAERALKELPSIHLDNQVNLCNSCEYTYPECPSGKNDVVFGNGIGNDNICACSRYVPSAQPEQKKGIWIEAERPKCDGTIYFFRQCNVCGFERMDDNSDLDTNYCPFCGADMRGEIK